MSEPDKPLGRFLTVVIRNEANFIFMQEPCTYRTVHIELTPEQEEQLALRYVGQTCGSKIYENVAHCFLEPSLPQMKEQHHDI